LTQYLSSTELTQFKSVNRSGVLLLNKPVGITSNRALQTCKRLFSATKAGHTGTLDPMAQGLLPICLGEATKFSSALLNADKIYVASLKLGYLSNTGDIEGEIKQVVHSNVAPPSYQQITAVLEAFIGRSKQIPPMFSALKQRGKPLYQYAREGIVLERKPREIIIHELSLNTISDFVITIIVHCSSGTYIRTLAEDIGKALGYGGAYLTALTRTSVSHFNISQACSLEQLESVPLADRFKFLSPIDSLLENIPTFVFNDIETVRLLQGQTIKKDILPLPEIHTKLRLYDSKNIFLGVGEWIDSKTIAPKRMINSAGIN
jgi:tRNA pseudouridine55 synthase